MLTLKQIDGRIKTLKKSGYNTVNDNVQEIAVSIVNHANDYGDCSRALALVLCVPPLMRPLLTGWFTNVSPINVKLGKTPKDNKVSFRKPEHKTYNPFDIEKAKANNWHENPFKVDPETPPAKTFDEYSKSVTNLFERMEKDAGNEAKIEPTHADDVRALRAHLRAAFIQFMQSREAGTTEVIAPEVQEQLDQWANPAEAAVAAA